MSNDDKAWFWSGKSPHWGHNQKANPGPKPGRKKRYGRNKVKCERYRAEGRRERNKIRRLQRHCRKHGNDAAAAQRLTELGGSAPPSLLWRAPVRWAPTGLENRNGAAKLQGFDSSARRHILAGCSSAGQSACFGSTRTKVQILLPRPFMERCPNGKGRPWKGQAGAQLRERSTRSLSASGSSSSSNWLERLPSKETAVGSSPTCCTRKPESPGGRPPGLSSFRPRLLLPAGGAGRGRCPATGPDGECARERAWRCSGE